MHITRVAISNYRNLDSVEVILNPTINFLVGENELGKSNFLHLLDLLFNGGKFSDEDFFDQMKSIKIEFSLHLSDVEKGAFGDIFDPETEKSDSINIIAKQESPGIEERMTFYRKEICEESPVEIPSHHFRCVNFIKYDSLRTPREELTFYRGRGVSKFLGYLVQELISQAPSENKYIVENSMDSLITEIQRVLDKLKPLKDSGIGLFTDADNTADLLSRILKLKGADGFDIQRSGYGVQFSAVIILSILERLMYLKQRRRWDDSIFTSERLSFTEREYKEFRKRFSNAGQTIELFERYEEGKVQIAIDEMSDEQRQELGEKILDEIKTTKNVSLILGLDEPEIHLHPYKQRNLIKYIRDLLNNSDEDFSSLLKEVFGIDGINGQAIVVSHSPSVLLDEYQHIVRFFRENGVGTVSGQKLQLDQIIDSQMEKHLHANLPYIKEAFFAKCVVVVEGDTELGALPLWAEKIIGDPNEFGIAVINAHGVESVPPIMKLLSAFRIPRVGVIDKDKNNNETKNIKGLSVTAYKDFEEELFETIYAKDSEVEILFEVLREFGTQGLNRYGDRKDLQDVAKTYGIANTWDGVIPGNRFKLSDIQDCTDKNLLKVMLLHVMKLRAIKTVTFGRFLGQKISGDLIPQVYREVLKDAKSKAGYVDG